MKKIKLTQGKYALVDDEDFEWLSRWKWIYDSGTGYAIRSDTREGKIYMHRFILKPPKNFITDHINRDKLDDRKKNLRISNKQQNGFNRDKNKNNTSGFKGVTWHRKNQKWIAQIMLNGKMIYLGSYLSKSQAVESRSEFDKKLEVI